MIYTSKLIEVIDGDTIDLKIQLGFGIEISERIRLAGYDTPEIHNTKHTSLEYMAGKTEALRVIDWFNDAPEWCILEVLGKGYFGRWVGIVRPAVGEQSLNEFMIARGWGVKTWTRNGRPYWNPLAEKIDINYPLGKFGLLGPASPVPDRER